MYDNYFVIHGRICINPSTKFETMPTKSIKDLNILSLDALNTDSVSVEGFRLIFIFFIFSLIIEFFV